MTIQTQPPWGLVDLFAGAGGASVGFLSTGRYEHVYAADNDPHCVETYRANGLGAIEQLDLGRLAERPKRLAKWAQEIQSNSAPLALVACAPCQGFSSHAKVLGSRLHLNNLLLTIPRFAAALQPDSLFVENVPDVAANRNWPVFEGLVTELEALGYAVRARIINLAELGVPQERFRMVLLARRGGGTVSFPARERHGLSEYATVRDAIGSLPPVAAGQVAPDDEMHRASNHRRSTIDILRQVPADGGSRPVGVGPECLDATRGRHGGYTDVYGRLAWDEPAPTITARCRTPSTGRFAHPEQDRGMTPREAGLLQTFPQGYQFLGPWDDKFKQVGNAVPPLAARAFAQHIADGFPDIRQECGEFDVTEPIGESFSVQIPGIRRRREQELALT